MLEFAGLGYAEILFSKATDLEVIPRFNGQNFV